MGTRGRDGYGLTMDSARSPSHSDLEPRTPSRAGQPLSTRLYARLLRAYPADFHRRYADQMVVLFTDQIRDARGNQSRTGLAITWIRALADPRVHRARRASQEEPNGGPVADDLRTDPLNALAWLDARAKGLRTHEAAPRQPLDSAAVVRLPTGSELLGTGLALAVAVVGSQFDLGPQLVVDS